jgi:imidazolonepropionase-like amidohydrolase
MSPTARQAQAFGIQSRNLKKMNDANVRVVLGTDGNTAVGAAPGNGKHGCLRMTPMQGDRRVDEPRGGVLATEQSGLDRRPARARDFIVLDANPLDNITNTRRINAVYHKARW